jgi:hypothetical protein
MSREAYEKGRVRKARQDGSREFISLLACISAIGQAIPPLLIYAGVSGDLMNTWVDKVSKNNSVHFAVSYNRWSNNQIGLAWLEQVFEQYTKPKRATTKRLLIVNGYSSYINIKFVDFADRYRIIILVLPPYTTHRLQLLDIDLFQPLSTAYSEELDNLMSDSGGAISMSKAFFYPMFKKA